MFATLTSATSCSTTYLPTTTAICHTTLTPLGGLALPVSACDQNVTFSTDHGIATAGPPGALLTTRYVAPWADVAAGVPTGVVEAEVCDGGGGCVARAETWSVLTRTVAGETTDTLSVNTVVTGVSA